MRFKFDFLPVLKRTMPLRQANSVGSTCRDLNFDMISCRALISVMTLTTFSAGASSEFNPEVNKEMSKYIKQIIKYK